MKRYKAVFFDWDGTAVYARTAPSDRVIEAMRPLLGQGVNLAVISGTTIENIAGGRLHEAFTPGERRHLFYGLARGALNYRFDEQGALLGFASGVPERAALLRVHEACFRLHQWLLERHDLPTDIVFSRPNYCKLDLMASAPRGDRLFMQDGEMARLNALLADHGVSGGVRSLIDRAEALGAELGVRLKATTDAKYLEVGPTLKSDNVDSVLAFLRARDGIQAADCSFWGDEFISVGGGPFGSDSHMMTEKTRGGDFFDVSDLCGERPEGVVCAGGGVEHFLGALREMAGALNGE